MQTEQISKKLKSELHVEDVFTLTGFFLRYKTLTFPLATTERDHNDIVMSWFNWHTRYYNPGSV